MAEIPDTVRAHWSTFVVGLEESPPEFYTKVEAAVAKRTISGAQFERIEYREGGAFSGLRLYLRIRRHHEVFDVCAAPFGNGLFFSWWLAEVRAKLPAFVSILIAFGYFVIVGFFVNQLGFFRGPIVLLFLVPVALMVFSQMGRPETDDFILILPLLGPLYERFFRPITYYRLDTSEMFQLAVQTSVLEVVDEVTSAKGIRALTELERKPVMRDFFRK